MRATVEQPDTVTQHKQFAAKYATLLLQSITVAVCKVDLT